MSLVLTDNQEVQLSISPKSAAGNPAAVDGVPAWTSSSPDVLTLQPSEDGLSCLATTTGVLGTSQVQCVADAKIGDGVKEITAVLSVEVKAGEAVQLAINAGEPIEKPS